VDLHRTDGDFPIVGTLDVADQSIQDPKLLGISEDRESLARVGDPVAEHKAALFCVEK
jgi:hypothetical protein